MNMVVGWVYGEVWGGLQWLMVVNMMVGCVDVSEYRLCERD